MKNAVVDANVICQFQRERISGNHGIAMSAISHIFNLKGYIALDDQYKIHQEWINTARGPIALNLSDWISERLQDGSIKVVSAYKEPWLGKQLTSFGMGKKDHKYIQTAVGSVALMIVTEDIDFHDPTQKSAKSFAKDKIRQNKSGCVCRFLRKEFGLLVRGIEEVEADFI